MRSINKVILIGHVAADPEIRTTKTDKKVATFSLATNREWVGKDSTATATDFHRIVAWNRLAEIVGKYVTKGSGLYIEGRLMNRSYDAKDGSKRYITEIHLDTINMLNSKQPVLATAGEEEPAPEPQE